MVNIMTAALCLVVAVYLGVIVVADGTSGDLLAVAVFMLVSLGIMIGLNLGMVIAKRIYR